MTDKPNIAFTAPHFAASQVGLNILEKGGTAIEAMVAAATPAAASTATSAYISSSCQR